MEMIASWVAPVATTIAALMTASNLGTRITGWGFAVFLIGSIAWGILGLVTDQPSLVWQNVILSILNLFGIWRWLGRQARIEEGARIAAEASSSAPGETLFPISLLGKAKVTGEDGTDLGLTIDAMAGCRSGRIAYLVASEGGVAGIGETLRRIDWTRARVDGDTVRLAGVRDLTALTAIAPDDWPIR